MPHTGGPQFVVLVVFSVCSAPTETIGLIRGQEAQDGPPPLSHSVVDDDEEVMLNVLRCPVDVLGTSCDQCRSMVSI